MVLAEFNKKHPSQISSLRRVHAYTRGTTQIALKSSTTQGSSKPFCTNVAYTGGTTEHFRASGSEVRGHWTNSFISSHQPLTL